MRRLPVAARAQLHAWRGHAQRWRARLAAARRRGLVTSALLVTVGMTGALLAGWQIAGWMLGLVALAESAGLIWVGLAREDGEDLPARGSRTVAQVLADENIREG